MLLRHWRERRAAERASRYWDTVAQGDAATPGGLDPDLVDALDRLQALGAGPKPDAAFADRLETRLIGGRPMPVTDAATIPPALTTNPNGRSDHQPIPPPSPPPLPFARERPRWGLAQLATAALLLLTLAAGLLLLRVERPGMIAPAEPLVETLLDQTVEVGGTPGGWVPIAVERWSFAPGAATLTVSPLDGLQWVVADGGTLVAAVDGQERELAPGKALVVAAGQELALRNGGTGEAAVIRGIVSGAFANEVYDQSAIGQQVVLDTSAAKAAPVGASRLVFVRMTLPSRSALPPDVMRERDWFGVVEGRLGLTLSGAKLPVGWKRGVERELAAFEQVPRLVPGTEVTLRNIAEEPLVVLRLTVLPVDQVSGESGEAAAAPANVAHGMADASAAERVAFGRRRPRRPRRSRAEVADAPG